MVFFCVHFLASADSRQKAGIGDTDGGHHRRPRTKTVQTTQLITHNTDTPTRLAPCFKEVLFLHQQSHATILNI